MTLTELRTDMMKSKRTDPERAKVLQAILAEAQLIAKEDKNREVTEQDIVAAAKKELKMATQSKAAGAPFNERAFEVCNQFLPKMLSEDETKTVIGVLVGALPEKSPKLMGQIMGILTKEYGDTIDKGLASKILKESLV